ncbi:MAG: hypothetical protein R2764_10935 [Bacteroidales bacterium]
MVLLHFRTATLPKEKSRPLMLNQATLPTIAENNSSTDYMTLTNATLTGEFQCGSAVYFRGTTTNNSLMHNDYYNANPELYDLFINNGTIQNESGGLTLKIFGDFTNNNIIENSAMDFYR